MTCESFLALPAIVAQSDFMATLPRRVFELNAFRAELRAVPILDELPRPTVHVIRRHDLPLTLAAQDLIGWIRNHAPGERK